MLNVQSFVMLAADLCRNVVRRLERGTTRTCWDSERGDYFPELTYRARHDCLYFSSRYTIAIMSTCAVSRLGPDLDCIFNHVSTKNLQPQLSAAKTLVQPVTYAFHSSILPEQPTCQSQDTSSPRWKSHSESASRHTNIPRSCSAQTASQVYHQTLASHDANTNVAHCLKDPVHLCACCLDRFCSLYDYQSDTETATTHQTGTLTFLHQSSAESILSSPRHRKPQCCSCMALQEPRTPCVTNLMP